MLDRVATNGAMITAVTGVASISGHSIAQVMPIVCGCTAALLARSIAITQTSKRKRVWIFEILVTALSLLLTAVITAERDLTIMTAVFCGMGIGALGVGVISIARTAALTMVTNLAKSVLTITPVDPPKP